MSSWKRVERWFARDLGGQRVPITGRQGAERMSKDIEVPYPLWVDVKSRLSCPKSLWSWLENVVDNAPPAKIPLLILHRPHMRYGEAVVVMRYRDFKEVLRRAYGDVDSLEPSE